MRVSSSSPKELNSKSQHVLIQILICRAELSKPEFKTKTYFFLTAGESQLIHNEKSLSAFEKALVLVRWLTDEACQGSALFALCSLLLQPCPVSRLCLHAASNIISKCTLLSLSGTHHWMGLFAACCSSSVSFFLLTYSWSLRIRG